MSKKAPTFGEEMYCEKIYKSIFYDLSVDKSFREGIQDTSTTISVHNWFEMPPQSQVLWVKVYPDFT